MFGEASDKNKEPPQNPCCSTVDESVPKGIGSRTCFGFNCIA